MSGAVSERLAGMVSRRLQLLSDPVRIRLVFALRDGEASVGQLADLLDRSSSNISHHLAPLYREGVLDRRSEGATAWYSLADFSACQLLVLAGEGVNATIEELSDAAAAQPPASWFT